MVMVAPASARSPGLRRGLRLRSVRNQPFALSTCPKQIVSSPRDAALLRMSSVSSFW